jgi:hypothetical protein
MDLTINSTELAASSAMRGSLNAYAVQGQATIAGATAPTGVPYRRARNILLPKSNEPSSVQQRNIIHFPKTGVYI